MTYIQGTYHFSLVLLSLLIFVFASYCALYLYDRVTSLQGTGKLLWTIFGSTAMGLGMWSMHFVGMLAYYLPAAVSYDVWPTLLSMLLPILAAWAAFWMIARDRLGKRDLLTGVLLMGLAIGGMHYAGMEALQTPLKRHYDPLLAVISISIAFAVPYAAFKLLEAARRKGRMASFRTKLGASLLLGIAIAGLHYTAMAAVSFEGTSAVDTDSAMRDGMGHNQLAMWIGAAALMILLLIIATQAMDKRFALGIAEWNKSRYDSIFEHNPDMVCLFDKDGRLVRVNPAAERVTGYPESRLLGRSFNYLMNDRDAARLRDSYRRVLLGASQTIEFTIRNKDGHPVHLSTTIVPWQENGTVQDIYTISKDITKRRQAEQDLLEAKGEVEEALRIKSDFLAVMSHEIRTPLNGVLGMSEILMETDLDEKQKQYVTVIIESGSALLAVMNDVLDLSKLESGKMTVQSEPFELSETLRHTIHLFTSHLIHKNLYVHETVDPALHRMFLGDEQKIRQVLINLISNAIKFTESGGIEITVRPAEAIGEIEAQSRTGLPDADRADYVRVEFSVKDSGIGIRKEEQRALFQPFYQTDTSIERRCGGTGLGLAISKNLVELMGGGIRVESTEGEGSCFTFTVLLKAPSKQLPEG
jgi:PAS domain S-box-containing protein